MADGFGNVSLSQRPKLPFDPERPLGTKFDRDSFLSPFSIIIEYCNRSTFHTKHRPEKYAEYFQATRQVFHERYPAMEILGNPEEHFNGRRAWKVQDELRPLDDVSRPRLGAFEVTLICSRTGPRTVFSKLESGCWPNPKALVERAECVSKFGEPLPPVLGYKDSLKFSRQLDNSPLPGVNCLKVKRNLPLYEPRFQRSWNPPAAKPPQQIADLRELSTHLCRRGGPTPRRPTKQPREEKLDSTGQDFALGIEGFAEFAEAYLQEEKSWQSWHKSAQESGLFDEKDVAPPAVDEKLGLVVGEEARERLEPQVPSTSRPSSRLSRPGSSARHLVQPADDVVTETQPETDLSHDKRGNTYEVDTLVSIQPEKELSREQRGSTYEEFEEDEFETQQQAGLGDSWSEFEDSRILDSRERDGNDEEPTLGDEVEVLPGVTLSVAGKEYYGPSDKGRVSKDIYSDEDEGIDKFEVTWYRTGLTSTIQRDAWTKNFCLIGDKKKLPSLGDELEVLPGVELAIDGEDYYNVGDKGRTSKELYAVENCIDQFEVTWYRTGLTSRMKGDMWLKSFRFIQSGKKTPSLDDELEALPNICLHLSTDEESYRPGDKGRVSKETYVTEDDAIEWFEVTWYRTGLTSVMKTDEWLKNFRLVESSALEATGQPNAYEEARKTVEEDTRVEIEKDYLYEMKIEISRSESEKFGMVLQSYGELQSLVKDIRPGGKVDEWNEHNPDSMICVGDRLVAVNGKIAHREMVDELKRSVTVTIIIEREEELVPHLYVLPEMLLATEFEVAPPPPGKTFEIPAPPLPLEEDRAEPPHEVLAFPSGESLASPTKPSRRPPLPPSTILPPSAPELMDSGLLGEPEESFTFLQPEGCNEDVNALFTSPPFPAPAPQRTSETGYETRGNQEYDYAADFEDDLETLDDGQSLTDASDGPDSLALFNAESNSLGDKESVTNAESSDDSGPEDSIGLGETRAHSSHVGSLDFVGLANVEDHTSEEDDEIGMVARAIAHGDAAESENSYNSADIVEVRGRNGFDYDEDEYGDDWITPLPPGSSRESKTPTRSRRAQDDSSPKLESDDEKEEEMLS